MWKIWFCQLSVKIGNFEIIDESGSITTNAWIAGGLIMAVIIAFIYYLGKEARLTKAGNNSPEKQRIARIISEVSQGDTSLEPAYAYWSTVEIRGGQKITRYWYYAIGFNKERICVVPISITDSKPHQISYSNYYIVEPDQLGLVNGAGNWVELYDKEGNKIVSLMVDYSVTDSSLSDHKLNVTQEETFKRWANEIIPYWMEKVNTANGTKATGHLNNANRFDFAGQGANIEGGGKAKNM